MEAKGGNGRDAVAERKRTPSITLTAPDGATRDTFVADASGEPSAQRVSPGDATVPVHGAATVIGALGESAVFGTSLHGYTLFHMLNGGPGEAELSLTWLGDRGPELARMFTNRVGGTEIFRDQFKGAKVVVTNLSETSDVRVRAILTP